MFLQGSMTEILAQIFGLYMVSGAIGVLSSRNLYGRMIDEFRNSVMLTYLSGILAFIVGAVTVTLHNEWSSAPAIVITVVGWLALAEGVLLLAVPRAFVAVIAKFRLKGSLIAVLGLAVILLGAWLMLTGLGVLA